MDLIARLKPRFWDHHDAAAGPYRHLFNFRLIWKQAVFLTATVTLLPLIFMAAINYTVSRNAMVSEIMLRTERLVSNTRRSVTFFLTEQTAALDFVVRDNPLEDLRSPRRLSNLLSRLQSAFGGFSDIGLIDQNGRQIAYAGPFELEGVNYSSYGWYQEVLDHGIHISDIFLGERHAPHLVIAIKHVLPDGNRYVLRATITMEKLYEHLSQLHVSGGGDAFIINRNGILQTPSRFYGDPLSSIPLPVPAFAPGTQVQTMDDPTMGRLLVGYAFVENTPFLLMICKQEDQLMMPWHRSQREIMWFLAVSIASGLLVILGVSTYLVERVFEADQRRVATLHQVEYANKMASIGRLAAGVAHEINNPLAIINEKAGLIKDLFIFQKAYGDDPKLLGLVDSVLSSVDRCATITRRLLNFARHLGGDSSIQPLHVGEVIDEVLGFLDKEASYRRISVVSRVSDDLPLIETDRGKLQQILLNMFNNAFAAMQDGGRLEVSAAFRNPSQVTITVTDDGCGIPEDDLKRIFEPFFSTKTKQGGTGLGLSITYSLIKELGGEVHVASTVGKGTTFTITLPLTIRKLEGETNASAVGG